MNKPKRKGTAYETSLLPALRQLDPRVERAAPHGAKDVGDFTPIWLRTMEPSYRNEAGMPLTAVVSAKNHKTWRVGEWLREAEQMRLNAKADYALLVPHLAREGDPMMQPVIMRLKDLIRLLGRLTPDPS